MRRIKLLILCILCMFAGVASATQIVATITSYNSVELSGAASEGVKASFENTNHSKGQITAGNKATMTLSNVYDGAFLTLIFYVKSNAKSGAGSLRVTLDDETIAEIPESSYAKWSEKGFSTDYLPFVFNGYWANTIDSKLVCEIEATENSLTWEKLEVYVAEYTPSLCTVNLSWLAADGSRQNTVIEETEVGAGIILPDCEVKTLTGDRTWTFVGWSREEIIDTRTTEPSMFNAGSKFYPTTVETLYAVYVDNTEVVDIVQTTDFRSGEYALVMACTDSYYIASSEVENKKITARQCGVTTNDDGIYKLTRYSIDVEYRYHIDFDEDSLSIVHLYSGKPIGHSGIYLANNKAKWAWSENKNHSLELSYNSEEKDDGTVARVLWLAWDDPSPYFEVTQLKLGSDYEYLLLFDVSDVPTSDPKTKWTSYPFGWNAVEQVTVPETGARKVLRNGVVLIERGNTLYNILGNKQN